MAKEIAEQPEVVWPYADALCRHGEWRARGCLSTGEGPDHALRLGLRHGLATPAMWRNTGSRQLAGLPVDIDIASEFRYREPPLREQAGRSSSAVGRDRRHARLRCAMPEGKGQRASCRSSTCRPRPSRARAIWSLPTLAGPEIGVASTKAFTCQLTVLAASRHAAGFATAARLSRRGSACAASGGSRHAARPDERTR
jgi:glucosamine--fructose-6-phosphate aminotransferase (isomerizing)